jgi:glycosyltransferase involved in cell wall biosynthesis
MSNVGWLVNDCLTCIPGTKTFWHDLLEWIPDLIDKTNGYTNYNILANNIERDAVLSEHPSYIIRNATFFRRINLPCKQISLLQDCYKDPSLRTQQLDVCNNGDVVVFNSNFTYEQYKNDVTECEIKIISLGTDFNLFNKQDVKHGEVLPNSVLFVGANNVSGKRFDIILDLIKNTNYNFCLVMKDNFTMNHPRVKVFNKVNHEILVKIYNSCEMLICASPGETQHLASMEAGACNLPIITSNSGALYNIPSGVWGLKEVNDNYIECIDFIKNNKDKFSPREFLLNMGFDKETCKNRWISLIGEN